MKRLVIMLSACFFSLAAMAQTVSIKVNGTKNRQVILNSTTFDINNSTSAVNRTVTVTTLAPGQHTLKVIRGNTAGTRGNTTTTFTVRQGYDVNIIVTASGGVQVKEKKAAVTATRTAMTDADFAIQIAKIDNQWRNSSRVNAATTLFKNVNYYFTSAQAAEAIELVTGDANRLALAKLAYARVTDPTNFVTVYNLLASQANKDALASYVRTKGGADIVASFSDNFKAPMTTANFNNLVAELRNMWQANAKQTKITEVFSNPATYFTAVQVRELVSLLDAESTRLHLLKAAYSHVTDPVNFNVVYELLSTTASRVELENYVSGSTNTTTGTTATVLVNYNRNRVAMNDTEFTALYNKSRDHFRVTSVITDVTNAFASTSNYFTSYQAMQLINLVSGETTRLQLAKSAYARVTDPENFLAQMNNLLSLQTSEDELKTYVYAYKGTL
jgi:hypothetical protein